MFRRYPRDHTQIQCFQSFGKSFNVVFFCKEYDLRPAKMFFFNSEKKTKIEYGFLMRPCSFLEKDERGVDLASFAKFYKTTLNSEFYTFHSEPLFLKGFKECFSISEFL